MKKQLQQCLHTKKNWGLGKECLCKFLLDFRRNISYIKEGNQEGSSIDLMGILRDLTESAGIFLSSSISKIARAYQQGNNYETVSRFT